MQPTDDPAQDDSSVPSPHFQAPHPGPSLPPEAYNHLIQALLSLQRSASDYPYPHDHLPTYHPWPPGTAPQISPTSTTDPSSAYPTSLPIPLHPHATPQSAGSSHSIPSSSAHPTAALAAQDTEEAEGEVSTAEDKRRRNTAASARFRLKKKLRTLNLEHTVIDLTGRTEELEREATDLRRENSWLKEIVLLKGRNLAAMNVASGSQAPPSGDRRDTGEKDDRTHTEPKTPGSDSTAKRKEKGKDKEGSG